MVNEHRNALDRVQALCAGELTHKRIHGRPPLEIAGLSFLKLSHRLTSLVKVLDDDFVFVRHLIFRPVIRLNRKHSRLRAV